VKAVPWDTEAKERLAESQASSADPSGLKSLAVVAADPEAAYKPRTAAVLAFAKLRGASDIAFKGPNGELDLLAAKQAPDALAADKPFYFEARLKAAAASSSPDVRIRLLRGALEYFPFADSARVPLFQAAMQQSKYQTAVNSLEPLNETGALSVDDNRQSGEMSPQALQLNSQDRAKVVASLARAFEKLERYDQSVTAYQQAIRLEKTPNIKTDLRKSLNGVRTILSRRKLNLSRQPLVRAELDQTNVVRPRLELPKYVSPPRVTPTHTRPPTPAQGARRTQ
jgi:tetratricopeptide (TPR) repeat protein